MLQASLSTVIAAVITTNIFLISLTLCLSNKRLMLGAGYRLLALFVLFTVLRLALPFEFPFTITVQLPKFIPPIVSLCRVQLCAIGGLSISLWTLLLLIWAAGTAFGIIRYVISYCKTCYLIILYGKELTHKSPYKELLERICRERKRRNRFRVIELPGLDSPELFSILSPRILVPEKFELPEQNLYYILRHETSHHFHHDLLLKMFVKLITLVYWWDPFCRKFNEQTDAILEMRVDDTLTLMDTQYTGEYMRCLIAADEFAIRSKFLPDEFTLGLLPRKRSDILKRFIMMRHNQLTPRPVLNTLLVLMTLSIYLLSYVFIGEPFNHPEDSLFPPVEMQDEQKEVLPLSPEDCYFIDNGDGTYDLYFYDEYLDTINTLEYYNKNIPVYTEENRPQ